MCSITVYVTDNDLSNSRSLSIGTLLCSDVTRYAGSSSGRHTRSEHSALGLLLYAWGKYFAPWYEDHLEEFLVRQVYRPGRKSCSLNSECVRRDLQ